MGHAISRAGEEQEWGWQELGSAVALTSEWICCDGHGREGLAFRAEMSIHMAGVQVRRRPAPGQGGSQKSVNN